MSSTREKQDTPRKTRLDDWHKQNFGVPKKGVWFFFLKDMLGNAPEGAFLVGWDTPKGAKCYAYYESPQQWFEQLSKNDLKCGYEVFVYGPNYYEYPSRSACLAYCDLEWEGDNDTYHLCAREILRRLFNVCETKLGFTPEVYVLCSTRKLLVKEVNEETGEVLWVWKGLWKNSYHFIIANLWAEKSKYIKQLFLPETLRTGVEDDLKEFDLSVYAKTQLVRMPLCTKRGSEVIFRRINKNPKDPEDDFTAKFDDDDLAAIRPALVTVFDKTKPTMHLLKKWTLVPKPDPRSLGSTGAKRKASLDTGGRDARPRTTFAPATPLTYSRKLASEVAGCLVAMHPDHVAAEYGSWRNTVFGALDATGTQSGAPPEFIEMFREFTRIRRAADRREEIYPRIANGTFASVRGGGDGETITLRSLKFNQETYPAACTFVRALNVDPLPKCRALLALEDVWLFELFEQFLRHVKYEKTSFKWLVQFASYVVPKLKDQVYVTIQGGYKDITKENFDLVWDGGKPSEIYEFAFKNYLADIVVGINSYIPPLVKTTAGKPGDEATADGSSKMQEAVASVGHVRTSKPKALGRQHKRFTKEQVLTYIVKTSASVHSLETPETLRKAVRAALEGQKDVDKATKELLGLWALLQGKSSKTGTAASYK
jgi:hypothetical protein